MYAAWGPNPTSIRSASPWRRWWKSTIWDNRLDQLWPSSPGSCRTPGQITAREPAASTASATASSKKYISEVVVTPKRSNSDAPRVMPQ